jgi:hypothetical protein
MTPGARPLPAISRDRHLVPSAVIRLGVVALVFALAIVPGRSALADGMYQTDWYETPGLYGRGRVFWTHKSGSTSTVTRVDWAGRRKSSDIQWWRLDYMRVFDGGCFGTTVKFEANTGKFYNIVDYHGSHVDISVAATNPAVKHSYHLEGDGVNSLTFHSEKHIAIGTHGWVRCFE